MICSGTPFRRYSLFKCWIPTHSIYRCEMPWQAHHGRLFVGLDRRGSVSFLDDAVWDCWVGFGAHSYI